MTPIAFTLTESDMIAATKLGTLATYRKNFAKSLLILFGLSAIVAVIIVGFGPGPDWSELPLVFGMMLAAYSVLSILGLVFVWAFFIKWRARKNMRQIAALSREQYLTWTETGFEVESSQGNSRFPYDEIHQWAANETSVILYPADHLFFAFPKRIFESEAQADEFLAALEASPSKRI